MYNRKYGNYEIGCTFFTANWMDSWTKPVLLSSNFENYVNYTKSSCSLFCGSPCYLINTTILFEDDKK